MAISTNSTETTRRNVLTGIGAATAALVPMAAVTASAAPAASSSTTDVDAVLAAWRAWRPLAEEWKRLNAEADQIEKAMPAWARNGPDIRINAVDFFHPSCVDEAISRLPDWLIPAADQLRACAIKGLSEGWARVEAERVRLGLTPRYERMDEIVDLQDPLITLIENAAGSHPIIVAAKMDLAVSCLDPRAEFGDTPQIYISAVIRGLLPELPADMSERLAPIAAGEGTAREIYDRDAAVRRAVS